MSSEDVLLVTVEYKGQIGIYSSVTGHTAISLAATIERDSIPFMRKPSPPSRVCTPFAIGSKFEYPVPAALPQTFVLPSLSSFPLSPSPRYYSTVHPKIKVCVIPVPPGLARVHQKRELVTVHDSDDE